MVPESEIILTECLSFAVFVAQLFAISDTGAAVVTVDCIAWKVIGALWLLAGPVLFIIFSGYKVHTLVKGSKTLGFNKSPTHTFKSMWEELREAPGFVAKASQAYIYFMDTRFTGGWVKKDDGAKFWGWLLAAYTDKFLPLISWLLAKKIFNALNKNWLDGKYNAVAHVVIYSVDVVLFVIVRPFRDQTVNLSQILGSISNLLGILAAALPILMPDFVPDWLNGSLVMMISSAGTAVMAMQALMDPLFKLCGTLFAVSGQAKDKLFTTFMQLRSCNVAGICSSVGTALWVRFQTIFLVRAKTAAASKLNSIKRAHETGEAETGQFNKAAAIKYAGMVYKKGIYNPSYKKRYLVLRNGILTWYKISDLAINEDEEYDHENSPPMGSWDCTDNTIEKVESTPSSDFHVSVGHAWGFVLTNTAKESKRVMVKVETSRDTWVSRLQLAIDALGAEDRVAEDAHLPSPLSMVEEVCTSAVIEVEKLKTVHADQKSVNVTVKSGDLLGFSNHITSSAFPPTVLCSSGATSSFVFASTNQEHFLRIDRPCHDLQAEGANHDLQAEGANPISTRRDFAKRRIEA